MLTIGYDASVTLAPSPRGIARYTLELLRALVALPREDLRFIVLLNSFRHKPHARHQFLFDNPRVEVVRRTLPGPMVVHGWRLLQRPTWEQITGRQCDVVHGPANYIPPSRAPVVVTVHDLGFLRDDEARSAPLAGKYFRSAFPKQLPGVARIITPSRFVADEISRTYGINRARIDAIHSGIDAEFFSPTKKLDAAARRKFGITKRFVLAVTAGTPRKRPEWIPEIAASCSDLDVEFVAVGLPENLRRNEVLALENISDEALAGLYASAATVLLTTREEGFGFPVLEALASGTPVVCGRNSSLEEIGGAYATYANDDSPGAFADAIRLAVLKDVNERATEYARSFTWRRCAEQVLETYSKARD